MARADSMQDGSARPHGGEGRGPATLPSPLGPEHAGDRTSPRFTLAALPSLLP